MASEMEMRVDPRAVEKLFTGRTVLCDGAMGTMLYMDGVPTDRCLEELNLSQPERVHEIHRQYLQAGAQVIETNTFGANAFRLQCHGLQNGVREINLAGVKLARECVEQASNAFVAGAIGPLGLRGPVPREAYAAYAEQVRAMVEGGPGFSGVDLLIVETVTSLDEAEQALRAARAEAPGLPLIVMVTVNEQGNCLDGASPEIAAKRLTVLGVDALGCNCSFGPVTVLRAIERMRRVTPLPLAAMPNAGLPQVVEGRSIYRPSPEEIAGFAQELVKAGATFVGGCCGTTPEHIRAMRSALKGIEMEAQEMEVFG